MTGQEQRPCNGCEERCVGCHGRNPDGNWRCSRWGAVQDALEEERRRTAVEQKGRQIFREYGWDSRRRHEIRKHTGHMGR